MVDNMSKTSKRPSRWNQMRAEIHEYLRETIPDYEDRMFMAPGHYLDPIEDNPGKYPVISRLPRLTLKRYITYYLQEEGWIRRDRKTNLWMLPEASKSLPAIGRFPRTVYGEEPPTETKKPAKEKSVYTPDFMENPEFLEIV